ncbi:hypothetical protein COL91_18560 [Bacillus pseudomycoides]|nr:hypothetical protein COL91_18560 [Bacillus pseudomycoides]PHF46727.1 hypothetical protein COF72_12125 [Bacillus pseudomycoides]
MQDDLRKRLENSTYADLKATKDHLAIKENAESLASIFKSGSYDAHVEVKKKNLTYSIVKDTAVELVEEITGVSFVGIFVKAVQQLWKTPGSEEAVERFIAEIHELSTEAVQSEVIGLKHERDPRKHAGKMELAKDIVRAGGSYEQFERLDIFTQEELKEIKDAAK